MRSEPPKALYRYFRKREHAQMFANGIVRLSTFSGIRKSKGKEGDAEEGKGTYHSGLAWWSGAAKNQAATHIEDAGLFKPPPGAIAVYCGNTLKFGNDDAYVLCMTLVNDSWRHRKVFGWHRVEIREPLLFFNLLTNVIQTIVPTDSWFDPVDYGGRDQYAEYQPIQSAAFRGPASLRWEREARMLWVPQDANKLDPVEIEVPELKHLCKLLPFGN